MGRPARPRDRQRRGRGALKYVGVNNDEYVAGFVETGPPRAGLAGDGGGCFHGRHAAERAEHVSDASRTQLQHLRVGAVLEGEVVVYRYHVRRGRRVRDGRADSRVRGGVGRVRAALGRRRKGEGARRRDPPEVVAVPVPHRAGGARAGRRVPHPHAPARRGPAHQHLLGRVGAVRALGRGSAAGPLRATRRRGPGAGAGAPPRGDQRVGGRKAGGGRRQGEEEHARPHAEGAGAGGAAEAKAKEGAPSRRRTSTTTTAPPAAARRTRWRCRTARCARWRASARR